MNRGVENFERIKEAIREHIKTLRKPFSVQDIAKEFDISWNTARAILLELALEGEVGVMKTTKSYVFIPKGGEKNEGNKA